MGPSAAFFLTIRPHLCFTDRARSCNKVADKYPVILLENNIEGTAYNNQSRQAGKSPNTMPQCIRRHNRLFEIKDGCFALLNGADRELEASQLRIIQE
jgi:hypothetical protein